ncbi:beta-defensin 41-like [Trichosurus vulpecula]|uniref:beta-defensin 41-like n=1 Tax=Trichosurus vulpecula TaxID=9337 RepID=UPI00186AD438|nr:beta-defensin 41-like [Trichosurus vulpecula]
MKMFFFIFFLLFYGSSIIPARSGAEIFKYGSYDYGKKCKLAKGTCKQLCSEFETRISYCIKPSTVCCI